MPSQEYLRERFNYNEEAGVLTWRTHLRAARYVGKEAGSRNGKYLRIRLDGKGYLFHRIVWIYMNGEIPEGMNIDHIDNDPLNNRIDNLRLATHHENMWNRPHARGYRFKDGSYQVSLVHKGEYMYLGSYKTKEEAKSVYKKKALELRGEFAVK